MVPFIQTSRQLFINFFKNNLKFNQVRTKSTIYALSSGHGKCGVAVIRVSGPKSSEVISKMTTLNKRPTPRKAMLLSILDSETRLTLDKGIVLWFPGPNSFTGEDCCELQVHGGLAVISSILASLQKLEDFQPAQPGEFTRRAFYTNKLDLTEVEGLADLIEAETEFQRRQALYQMEGNLSRLYSNWRESLSQSLAFVEAYIDFSEDEPIEDDILDKVETNLKDLSNSMEMHLLNGRKGERLRSGVRTSILGSPNVGKSSLLNTLCERPAAIVTEIPGTTRDIVESTLNINGYPIILADTAGLRDDATDIVEIEGINRAYQSSEQSEFLMLIIDFNRFINVMKTKFNCDKMNNNVLYDEFYAFLKEHIHSLKLSDVFSIESSNFRKSKSNEETDRCFDSFAKPKDSDLKNAEVGNFTIKCSKNYLIILNKIDLLNEDWKSFCFDLAKTNGNIVPVSCKTEENVQHLINLMTENLSVLCGNPSRETPVLSQIRHRYHINECHQALQKYFENCEESTIVMGAEHLRVAINHLGQITGHVSSEELLSIIFKQFCIGK